MRNIFIYGLRDPRDGKIKYVGQTANFTARITGHVCLSDRTMSLRSRKARWVHELNAAGLFAEPVVLQVCQEGEADRTERKWIASSRVLHEHFCSQGCICKGIGDQWDSRQRRKEKGYVDFSCIVEYAGLE